MKQLYVLAVFCAVFSGSAFAEALKCADGQIEFNNSCVDRCMSDDNAALKNTKCTVSTYSSPDGQCVMTAAGFYVNEMTGQMCQGMQLYGAPYAGYGYGQYPYSGYGYAYGSDPCSQAYGPQYHAADINGQLACTGY